MFFYPDYLFDRNQVQNMSATFFRRIEMLVKSRLRHYQFPLRQVSACRYKQTITVFLCIIVEFVISLSCNQW